MPITVPTEVEEIVYEVIGKVEDITALYPHRVFTLTLEEIAEGAELEMERLADKLAGWRVFSQDRESCLEIYSTGEGFQFAGINRGPFVQGTLSILEEFGDYNRSGEPLELNALRFPELYVMAVWLRHDEQKEDIEDFIVPMAPTSQVLEAGRIYSPEEFMAVLSEAAQERLYADELEGFAAP